LPLRDNQSLRHPRRATIIQTPRRQILILIVAAFPSRSPRYSHRAADVRVVEGRCIAVDDQVRALICRRQLADYIGRLALDVLHQRHVDPERAVWRRSVAAAAPPPLPPAPPTPASSAVANAMATEQAAISAAAGAGFDGTLLTGGQGAAAPTTTKKLTGE
jgi:hypothetical protein